VFSPQADFSIRAYAQRENGPDGTRTRICTLTESHVPLTPRAQDSVNSRFVTQQGE
jgi:hypothetical protein